MELPPVKLLMLAGNVDPEAALSAYRAGAIDLEANAVCRNCGRWQVDVLSASEIRRAIVLQREVVNVVAVHLAGPLR